MQIDNVSIYDVSESVVASGLPMLSEYDSEAFGKDAVRVPSDLGDLRKRVLTLASNSANSGHCNFLKGIIVSMNVSGTIKWWEQFQRYHFATIVSSMSTMHRLTRMNFDNCMSSKVLSETKDLCALYIRQYNVGDIDFDTLIDNMPLGIILTARVQTNYLQLRTIYNQRRNHKYHEWKPFCDWIESLPLAEELILVDNQKIG